MRDEQPYNPLDKKSIGKSVAEELLGKPVEQLPLTATFMGAGVYVIYYRGNFPPYAAIGERNRHQFQLPMYIGKAVPAGSRKGLGTTEGPVLSNRIREHAESINQASNLDVKDFYCQYLVVDDIWIPFGEAMLIQRFAPLWNHTLDGFGNHDPGSGRQQQKKSPWDTVHTGRNWAERLQPNDNPESYWLERIETYIRTLAPPILPPDVAV